MLSARQANGNEESGGRVAAAAAMATAMAESDGYRQLNGSLSGRPTTAAATLNGHNEPKSKQQIAKPADKSSSSLSSDARNNNNNDDELRPTSETPVGHRHHLRQHSLETGQADNLFGLPVDGDRERRLTSEQQQQQQHFDGDNDTNWRLIGANEGNDANNEQKRKQADEDDERDKGESSEGEPDETRQFIEATEKSAEDKKKAKEKKQDGVGRPAAAPAGGGGGAKKNVSPVWGRKLRAQLAKQESITERGPTGGQQKNTEASKKSLSTGQRDGDEDYDDDDEKNSPNKPSCCSRMLQFVRARKCLTIPLIILVIYIAAIYCLPFIEIDPKIPSELPAIPFDFHEGPLRPSSASAFKFKHLFKDQIHGPESLAFDSQSNLYMAIEGGFILYAHLNRSSPIKRAYLEQPMTAAGAMMLGPGQQQPLRRLLPQTQTNTDTAPELIKIADLNGMRQLSSSSIRSRAQRAEESSPWKRECQLDEKVYGPQLFAIDSVTGSFKSNVRVSRCSKPLGIRLNADESQLYVIDTLTGLYRVNLRSGDNKLRPSASGPRQVFKLIDFRANNGHQVLPAIQLEDEQQAEPGGSPQLGATPQYATRLMNVSMKALDDLVIDTTADNHDLIYMTVASQTWPATSFVFDVLEGRPSGLVLRYNTANNQLVVLEPNRVAHVRTSSLIKRSDDGADERRLNRTLFEGRSYQPSFLLGAPRLDENDIFDDRPLNFPNGLELTDDRQALLIADTSNKRIVRHYVRGPRRGTSDLWAWTPMFPDNIRRGYDKHQETYWVVGCGRAPASSAGGARWASGIMGEEQDLFALLRTWPRLRKFLLKNIYFIGYLVEFFGENLFNSNKIQDAGYELRTGSSLCSTGCTGMMIIQYNRHGDVIRSIHSREFPNDLYYYSQVNELIDPENQEHMLYLGSPSYSYLTKLTLPTESYAAADTNNNNNNNQR